MKLTSRNGKLYVGGYHKGKRIRESLNLDDTSTNRKYAEKHLIPEIIHDLNNGMFFDKKQKQAEGNYLNTLTVDTFKVVSFQKRAANRSVLTQREYERIYEIHIKPFWGTRKLASIKVSELGIWQSERLTKVSPARLEALRSVFNSIFEDAIDDEIIEKNPFQKVTTPKVITPDIHPLNIDEINAILKHAPSQYKAFFALSIFSGMRAGEIVALTWEDIDLHNRKILVNKSMRQGVLKSTKTGVSRIVYIIDVLYPFLENRYLSLDDKEKKGLIFKTRNNKPYMGAKDIYPHWVKTLKQLGIQHRRLHEARHTFASMMIEHQENIAWVSKALGHSSTQITLDRYAGCVKEENKRGLFFNDLIETI